MSVLRFARILCLVFPLYTVAQSSQVKEDLDFLDAHVAERRAEFKALPEIPGRDSWMLAKLAHMVEVDQFLRRYHRVIVEKSYSAAEIEEFWQGLGPRFLAIDTFHTEALKELLSEVEWFVISRFGVVADQNAWLLVQHADHDPDFQMRTLDVLARHFLQAETSPTNYAYLYDRVAASFGDLSKRRLQRYGTQGACVAKGIWEPIPVEDPARLDERRREVGLKSQAEYEKGFKDICK